VSRPRETESTLPVVTVAVSTQCHRPSLISLIWKYCRLSSKRDDSGGIGVISQCSEPYLTSLGRIVPWGMADRVKERDCIDDWNTKTKGGGGDGVGWGWKYRGKQTACTSLTTTVQLRMEYPSVPHSKIRPACLSAASHSIKPSKQEPQNSRYKFNKMLIIRPNTHTDPVQLYFIIHCNMFRPSRSATIRLMSGAQKEI
jgi:hypothetical protein